MHIYEYLFTAIIIVAMLLAASTMVGTFPESSSSISEKEQLKVVAQKLMTQLLLDPGDPLDWGSNVTVDVSKITILGLAKYSETTREAYLLDPDKVLRLNDALLLLNNTKQLYIPPYSATNLLNLGNEYGLKLEFYPALNVRVNETSLNKYEVSVTSDYGELPIVGANVTARLYYYNNVSQKIEKTTLIETRTSYDGNCTIEFSPSIPPEKKILNLVVDYYGVRIAKVVSASDVVQAYQIGDYLFLNPTYTIPGNANVTEVYVTKKAGNFTSESVTSPIIKVVDGKYNVTYVEPSTLAILAVSSNGDLVCATKETTLTYSTIPGVSSFPFAYSLERTVVISGSSYVVRLYVWRMSW